VSHKGKGGRKDPTLGVLKAIPKRVRLQACSGAALGGSFNARAEIKLTGPTKQVAAYCA
jgi:hypothetical protein